MVKSWLSFLLPTDEYKERKVLYFLAEASIILLLFLLILFSTKQILPYWSFGVDLVLGISIAILVFYVAIRYMFSGIEYTEIATEKAFVKERKIIAFKTLTFIAVFFVVYSIFIGAPNSQEQWIDILGLLTCAALIMFLSSYISLKRSYMKNKDLLDNE
ncbi:DUF3278 domain-containing protein [Rossellomorea sp. BNER]|uniref:DUF3278 domain-containing protein n=1 Tax=Rossellomorea sp. BNER TaxID=2962031 RepID=UPI003AF21D89|nr:DUF3278 domain-containing protein [Rossellomorea sp. BNER]